MIDKLKDMETRFLKIQDELALPSVSSDPQKSRLLMKEYKSIAPLVDEYHVYLAAQSAQDQAREILENETDPDFTALAKEELAKARLAMDQSLQKLKTMLLPKDPDDERGVIIEIRAGAGGEEAALFAGVLFRMYSMYAQSCGWKTDVISANETELGGFKEVSFSVEGDGAFSKFKFESGVHRVQRVPQTESQGRIQTSTVTVAVLPQAEDVEIEINEQDLEIDTHRASGAGGQHINKTDSAIRILHKPSGIVVECQDERSQLKNKEKAMRVLRSKLYQAELEKQNQKIASARRGQIGTGDRSERIRTYNYPQGRVTDHRIGLTIHSLESVLNGKLDDLISALMTASQMKKLEAGESI